MEIEENEHLIHLKLIWRKTNDWFIEMEVQYADAYQDTIDHGLLTCRPVVQHRR